MSQDFLSAFCLGDLPLSPSILDSLLSAHQQGEEQQQLIYRSVSQPVWAAFVCGTENFLAVCPSAGRRAAAAFLPVSLTTGLSGICMRYREFSGCLPISRERSSSRWSTGQSHNQSEPFRLRGICTRYTVDGYSDVRWTNFLAVCLSRMAGTVYCSTARILAEVSLVRDYSYMSDAAGIFCYWLLTYEQWLRVEQGPPLLSQTLTHLQMRDIWKWYSRPCSTCDHLHLVPIPN